MAAPVAHARLRRAPSLRLQGGTQRSSTVVALQSGPLMHIMRLPGPVFSTDFFFGYSQYAYDILGATQSGIIYPSLDPSIFEIKYTDSDIQGKVVSLGTGTFNSIAGY